VDRLRRHGRSSALAAQGQDPPRARGGLRAVARASRNLHQQPDLAGWSADGRTLYLDEPRGVYDLIYAQNVETGAIKALTDGKVAAAPASTPRRGWASSGRHRPTRARPGRARSPFPPSDSDVNANLPKRPRETRVIT
jgi:hypothetical protein